MTAPTNVASNSTVAGHPLAGTVSKALLIVAPAFARERDFLQYLKYKLYDDGFIVVREEYRLLNYELAGKLCVELDTPAAAGEGATTAAPAATVASSALPPSLLPSPQELVGAAYVFVLARTKCHTLLQHFVTAQLCGEDAAVLEMFLEEHRMQGRELPFWIPRTAYGAGKVVSLLFPRMLAEQVPSSAVSKEYVQENLKQALVPALAELARQKPENPLRWLAMQLLANNTQAPPMLSNSY